MEHLSRYTCEEVFQRLDDYLDRELTSEEMQQVSEHLSTCAVCASEHRFEAGVLNGVREKLRRIEAPADLLSKISALLRAKEDGA